MTPLILRNSAARRSGFSLIELLVVVAIISILMALHLATLGKAISKARKVAAAASLHDQQIGRMADHANAANHREGPADRDTCRQAFRHTETTAEGNILVSELCYVVENDAEFGAYWNTLLNPANTDPLEYTDQGLLIAEDEDGNVFHLRPIDKNGWTSQGNDNGPFIVMWEFLSTNLADTTVTGLGINVLYSDGHVSYLRYRSEFPATPTVADLSDRFLNGP